MARRKHPVIGAFQYVQALVGGLRVAATWKEDPKREVVILIPLDQLDEVRAQLAQYDAAGLLTSKLLPAESIAPMAVPAKSSGFKSIKSKT